jgi:hypothetical protein
LDQFGKISSMAPSFTECIEQAPAGTNPALICPVSSGWVVLWDMQNLRGYRILLADPIVTSPNDLIRIQRAEYRCDMALVGDALIEVTGAYRINDAIVVNSDPYLHAHKIPRDAIEPESYRTRHPWSYPDATMQATMLNDERDQGLIH